MEVKAMFDDYTSTFTYIVYDPESGDAIVIDPVLDYDPASSTTATKSTESVI